MAPATTTWYNSYRGEAAGKVDPIVAEKSIRMDTIVRLFQCQSSFEKRFPVPHFFAVSKGEANIEM